MLPVFFNSMCVKHGHIHQHDTRQRGQRDIIRNSATMLIMTDKYGTAYQSYYVKRQIA